MRCAAVIVPLLLFVAPVCSASSASSADDDVWTGSGWYRIAVFPEVGILSDPYPDQASCRQEIVPDNDHVYDCALLNNPGDEIDRALDYWDLALQGKPDNAAVLNFRGILYRQKGDNANALVQHNRAIKAEPDDYWGYLLRALVYRKLGQTDKAIADYRAVLARSPSADNKTAVLEDLKELGAKQ